MDIHAITKKPLFSTLYNLVHTVATRPYSFAGGIVFYANYLKFFERARTEWLRGLGLGQQALRDDTGGMFVVTDVQLTYHRPARLDDMLCVTAEVQTSGRASLLLQQRAWLMPVAGTSATLPHSVERNLLCEGTVRIGWVDAARMRPQRIPEAVLQALGQPTESESLLTTP